MTHSQHIYEVRPRKDRRGFSLISAVLPFGALWYTKTDDAVSYAAFFSRSHDAVIRVYDDAGNVIEMHERKGDVRMVATTHMFAKGLAALRIAAANLRDALRRIPWARRIISIIIDILALIELFFPFPLLVRLFLYLVTVVASHLFAPKIFKKMLEGVLSFSGDHQLRHFRPLYLDPDVMDKHKQLSGYSCIPMAVEFVLKLLGKLPPDDFHLQDEWGNRQDGNFSDFDGRTFDDIKFAHRFVNPRGESFPLDILFSTTENELASRRYVIISLAVPSLTHPGESDYHNYVIYNRLPDGEFEAVTKGREPKEISNVRAQVRNMRGTDILTYSSDANR